MIDINDLYKNFQSMYNTDQTGWYRPVSDFVPAVHSESLDIFNKLAGMDGRTQQIEDLLTPFERPSLNIPVHKSGTMEVADKPKDYQYFKAAGIVMEGDRICGQPECDVYKDGECIAYADITEDFFPTESNYTRKPLRLVKGNQWDAVLNHETRKPTKEKPAIRQLDTSFQVEPKGIGVIVLDYYRLPVAPVFAYEEVVDGPDTFFNYKKDTSQPIEWSEAMVPVFLYRLGRRYGLSVQDELIIQVTRIEKSLL